MTGEGGEGRPAPPGPGRRPDVVPGGLHNEAFNILDPLHQFQLCGGRAVLR